MADEQEVEIKFRILAPEKLDNTLREAGFRLITPRTHEMNTLYDLPGRKLRGRGALLRLRNYGDRWTLTYKDRPKVSAGRHKTRREIETKVENGDALDTIFTALGYSPSFAYEKFRTEWRDDTGHVVIDETPIGHFGEIEGPPNWIDQTAPRLAVSPRQYITASYAELFLDWKRKNKSKARQMLFAEIGRKAGIGRTSG